MLLIHLWWKIFLKLYLLNDKESTPELKSTIIEHLHNIILSTQEPHTIISAAWVLSQKYEQNILDDEALCTKLRDTYNALAVSVEDGVFSWMQKIIVQQEFYYTEQDLPCKNILCAGELPSEAPADSLLS